VLHLNQQLAALSSHGVRCIATSQSLDTDQANPTSRLLLQIFASVAEFEREMIRERTLAGLRVAKANGIHVGRPRRVFRRDEVVQLRESGHSWRGIATKLGIPVITALDAVPLLLYGNCRRQWRGPTPENKGQTSRRLACTKTFGCRTPRSTVRRILKGGSRSLSVHSRAEGDHSSGIICLWKDRALDRD